MEIVDDIQFPKSCRVPRGSRPAKYPFHELEIGQGFVVEADLAGWKTGVVRRGKEKGKIKKFSSVHQSASYEGKKLGRKFQCATDENDRVWVKRTK